MRVGIEGWLRVKDGPTGDGLHQPGGAPLPVTPDLIRGPAFLVNKVVCAECGSFVC